MCYVCYNCMWTMVISIKVSMKNRFLESGRCGSEPWTYYMLLVQLWTHKVFETSVSSPVKWGLYLPHSSGLSGGLHEAVDGNVRLCTWHIYKNLINSRGKCCIIIQDTHFCASSWSHPPSFHPDSHLGKSVFWSTSLFKTPGLRDRVW